jgi:bifunctional non-homologous end joining protein LigD
LDAKSENKEVKEFGEEVANFLALKNPSELTTEFSIKKRKERLFIDVHRNSFAQTSVCPYAIRNIEHAPIAAPIKWEELDDKEINSQKYNISNLDYLLKRENPWKDFFSVSKKGSIKDAKEKLGNLLKL